jgi:S1-C subfamily serine protease
VLVGEGGEEGVPVENVLSGSPAAGAGIGSGDVITSIDGARLDSPTALVEVMLGKQPGERVQVSWQTTTGSERSATLTLATSPPQ